jgi:dTDP-4-dehydrorhamnose 3,5-epimerase
MIEGVTVKKLVTHSDDRGFFREVIRVTDPFFTEGFGQLSHSLVYPGIVKAWHMHKLQSQWTYVVAGVLKVTLHDCRSNSPTFRKTLELIVGDQQPAAVYTLPPGVAHGYRCISGPAHVLYVTSGTYDIADEIRLPHNDPEINYDWLSGTAIR